LLLSQAKKYLIAHSTRPVRILRAMRGRRKKQENQFPPSKKLVQEQRKMKKTDTQIQTPIK
jgi:hypothetical protein